MAKVQLGLETTFKPGITLGNYQEAKIRWLHQSWPWWGWMAMSGFVIPSPARCTSATQTAR